MSELHCPKCACDYCYHDGEMNICPECAYEWRDGDSVVLIKALKPKGSSQTIKQGTKVKNIRLVPGADHNIDCKIEGFGGMMLKSEFVKKA